jgi:hypothetical protein
MKTIVLLVVLLSSNSYAAELSEEQALKLVQLSLTCVDQEFPNMHDRPLSPKKLHPAFYGCYDWHSAAHAHWAMVRVLKTFPKISVAKQIEEKLDRHLKRDLITRELKYFLKPDRVNFERPYGYGWFFRLSAELRQLKHPKAQKWISALEPLETYFLKRMDEYFELYEIPIRHGTHQNTSFSLNHIYDYAIAANNQPLKEKIETVSKKHYLKDKNCPLDYEPSGADFISSCLSEADLMRRVLPHDEFVKWLKGFLTEQSLENFKPLKPKGTKDPQISHLIGLNFHRAWSLSSLSKTYADLAQQHAQTGTDLMFGSGYGGTHWLATFAIFHFTSANLP